MKTIRIGAVAYDPKVVAIWEIIKEYAHQQHYPLDYILFSNYETQVEALCSGVIDFAWNTNVAWIRTKHQRPDATAILMRDTDRDFTSVFIAKTGRFNSLNDLHGQRIGFGSCDSAQAYILPAYALKEHGINDYTMLRIDSDVGKHGDTGRSEYDVLEKLKNNECDAISIATSTWLRMVESGLVGTNYAPFWKSQGYSHCNFTTLTPSSCYNDFIEFMTSMPYERYDIKQMMEMEALTQWIRVEEYELNGYHKLQQAMNWLQLI